MLIGNKLNKQYKKKNALTDFSFSLETGIVGLLGPNGAGKTTLMKIISTITKPSSGTLTYNGIDIIKKPQALRATLGFLPQDFGVYPNLNAIEFLSYIGILKGLSGKQLTDRVTSLLDALNLLDVSNVPLSSYSGGMKQRIGIAQVLLNDPQVMIFDEPTVGLDPSERINFRDMLSQFSQDRLIILSSHIVSDIAAIADQVMIMKHGQLIETNTVSQILKNLHGKVMELEVSEEDLQSFKLNHSIIQNSHSMNGYKVRFISNEVISNASVVTPNLEDAYIYSTVK